MNGKKSVLQKTNCFSTANGPVAYQTVKSPINQFGVWWHFFPISQIESTLELIRKLLVWSIESTTGHCWAGQQSIFKVKCGVNNLISSHDWTPGVPSVGLDLAAKFKPPDLQEQSVVLTHSSKEQSTDTFLLTVWWTFWAINRCGFLAHEPSEIIHGPVNVLVPRLLWMSASLAWSPAVTHKHLMVKIFPPVPAPLPILHKWLAGLDFVLFSLQFITYLFQSLIRAVLRGQGW